MKALDGLEQADIIELARADQTRIGQLVMRLAERKAKRAMLDIRRNPKVGTEDIKADIRYKIGLADGAEWLTELFRAARKTVTNGGGNDGRSEDDEDSGA